jgi:hypothetical protein
MDEIAAPTGCGDCRDSLAALPVVRRGRSRRIDNPSECSGD